MLGLRTQESEKFNAFWDIIQAEASKTNCVFFGDCGEGRDFETDTMEGEDFSGWLIPKADAENFETMFLKGNVEDKWSKYIVFALWKETNGIISVGFEKF